LVKLFWQLNRVGALKLRKDPLYFLPVNLNDFSFKGNASDWMYISR